jgi:hypothetical protein
VNGPAATVIDGRALNRCLSLAPGCVLSGFTVAHGNSTVDAGGVACADATVVITNCLFTGNYAANNGGGLSGGTAWKTAFVNNSAGNNGGAAENCDLTQCAFTNNAAQYYGGGADASTLSACLLVSNQTGTSYPPATAARSLPLHPLVLVSNFGGGANNSTARRCYFYCNTSQVGGALESSTADNCLIVSNSADFGGGVDVSTLYNCTLADNSAYNFGGTAYSSTLDNCLAYGNSDGDTTTNNPFFVNYAGGDYHLQSNSPCINAGANVLVISTNDLDGLPRIAGTRVDLGCYEYQTPASILSYAWAQYYGLPTDGSADYLDPDHTGLKNWQKSIAGLNPTNPASVLALLSSVPDPAIGGVAVTWQSVNGIYYNLERSTGLQSYTTIQAAIPGQPGTTAYTDTTATNLGHCFYRINVP